MASDRLHEAAADLSPAAREMHRAIVSLMEELEAVDWYGQRVQASGDEELREVLAHNRDEEIEHACLTLEWIRRRDPKFDEQLRKILFRSGSIMGAERARHDADGSRGEPTLGIGSLRAGEEAP